MTDRKTLDQMTSNDLDQLHARLDQAETELRWWAAADSADAAAGSYAHRAERAEAALARMRDRAEATVGRIRRLTATRSFMAGPNAVDVVRVADVLAALDEPAPGSA